METKETSRISLVALFFFALQYTVYKMANIEGASPANSLQTVIAYHFRFMMLLTACAGIWIPASLWMEKRTGKQNSAWLYGAGLFLATAFFFIVFSYVQASRGGEKNANFIPSSVADEAARKISTYVQFVNSDIELQNEEKILRMQLTFRNTGKQEITQMDYVFVALENGRIFYRLNMRDTFLVPPGKTGTGMLSWDRTKFTDPTLFDRMRSAFKAKTLRVYAKPTEIIFLDGTSMAEKI